MGALAVWIPNKKKRFYGSSTHNLLNWQGTSTDHKLFILCKISGALSMIGVKTSHGQRTWPCQISCRFALGIVAP